MKKLIFTTAVALVLATGAYAQQHHGPGPGGGGGMGSHGPSMGGGGRGPSMGGGPGLSGPSAHNMMGPNHGQTGNLYNRAPTVNAPNRANRENFNRGEFTERGPNHLYNRYEGNRAEGNRVEGRPDHRGVVSGNFFEHGRHFGFRRFFNGEWVFLNAWDDCTAWAWVNVAPGAWAWRPINVCIG